MAIKAEIKDGLGSSRAASVIPSNALLVAPVPTTARGISPATVANLRQLVEGFTDEAGSQSQAVDGSTVSVEFSLRAKVGLTRWVTGYRVIIFGERMNLGSSGEIRRYASQGGGLSTGIDVEVEQQGQTLSVTTAPVQTIGDWLLYSDDFTNLVNAVSASEDFLRLDFNFPSPVVLTEGSQDRLLIRINDDMTAALSTANADQFAIAIGYEEEL